MNKVKKSSIIIGIIGLLIVLVGVTYSFFNYTKTGLANNFRVGRIYFNSSQNGTINLTNVFPITSEELNGDIGNHGSVTININGDTTHDKGVEYLVTLDQVNNEVNGKKIPITFNTEATGVGTSNENYYDDRGGETSMYKLYETGDIEENKYLLAGYIAPGVTGINGNITVIAYVDAKKMVITDTYLNGGETDEEWVDGRIVFTTDEWSSLNGNNALSFKIKVEANEGIWVKEDITPTRCFTFSEHKKNSTYNIARTNKNIMDCVDYLTNKWGNEEVGNTVDVGETYDGFCSGTGTNWGRTISDLIEQNVLNNDELEEYNNIGIITINYTTSVVDYDISCGTDVIIPSKVNVEKTKKAEYVINENMNVDICVGIFVDWWGVEVEGDNVDVGETYEAYCNGTGTIWGYTFDFDFKDDYYSQEQMATFIENDIIIYQEEKEITPVMVTELYGEYRGDACFLDKGLTSVVIPNSIEKIDYGAFMGNQLTSIIIPNSVTIIDSSAFTNNAIEKVTLHEGLSVGQFAFSYNQIDNLVIPTNVTLEDSSFANNNLSTITIPSNVTLRNQVFANNQITSAHISKEVHFYGTTNSVIFKNNPLVSLYVDGNLFANFDDNYLGVSTLETIEFGNNVFEIGTSALADSSLTGVIILNNVTSIGPVAFSNNQLTSIEIGSSINYVGAGAFNHNQGLESIKIDKSCSVIKNMDNYPWIDSNYRTGTTKYGSNNEICDSW